MPHYRWSLVGGFGPQCYGTGLAGPETRFSAPILRALALAECLAGRFEKAATRKEHLDLQDAIMACTDREAKALEEVSATA